MCRGRMLKAFPAIVLRLMNLLNRCQWSRWMKQENIYTSSHLITPPQSTGRPMLWCLRWLNGAAHCLLDHYWISPSGATKQHISSIGPFELVVCSQCLCRVSAHFMLSLSSVCWYMMVVYDSHIQVSGSYRHILTVFTVNLANRRLAPTPKSVSAKRANKREVYWLLLLWYIILKLYDVLFYFP